jgi:hypothetical protein
MHHDSFAHKVHLIINKQAKHDAVQCPCLHDNCLFTVDSKVSFVDHPLWDADMPPSSSLMSFTDHLTSKTILTELASEFYAHLQQLWPWRAYLLLFWGSVPSNQFPWFFFRQPADPFAHTGIQDLHALLIASVLYSKLARSFLSWKHARSFFLYSKHALLFQSRLGLLPSMLACDKLTMILLVLKSGESVKDLDPCWLSATLTTHLFPRSQYHHDTLNYKQLPRLEYQVPSLHLSSSLAVYLFDPRAEAFESMVSISCKICFELLVHCLC